MSVFISNYSAELGTLQRTAEIERAGRRRRLGAVNEQDPSTDAEDGVTGCVPPVDPTVHDPQAADARRYMPSWVFIENGDAQRSLTERLHD
jgi:hypothetical protein